MRGKRTNLAKLIKRKQSVLSSNLDVGGYRVGRIRVTLVTRSMDILLLTVMAFANPVSARVPLAVLHVVRTSFANCTRPLMRSLLMDNVPSRHRGKFNALEGVRTFSWSGSAAAGG